MSLLAITISKFNVNCLSCIYINYSCFCPRKYVHHFWINTWTYPETHPGYCYFKVKISAGSEHDTLPSVLLKISGQKIVELSMFKMKYRYYYGWSGGLVWEMSKRKINKKIKLKLHIYHVTKCSRWRWRRRRTRYLINIPQNSIKRFGIDSQ